MSLNIARGRGTHLTLGSVRPGHGKFAVLGEDSTAYPEDENLEPRNLVEEERQRRRKAAKVEAPPELSSGGLGAFLNHNNAAPNNQQQQYNDGAGEDTDEDDDEEVKSSTSSSRGEVQVEDIDDRSVLTFWKTLQDNGNVVKPIPTKQQQRDLAVPPPPVFGEDEEKKSDEEMMNGDVAAEDADDEEDEDEEEEPSKAAAAAASSGLGLILTSLLLLAVSNLASGYWAVQTQSFYPLELCAGVALMLVAVPSILSQRVELATTVSGWCLAAYGLKMILLVAYATHPTETGLLVAEVHAQSSAAWSHAQQQAQPYYQQAQHRVQPYYDALQKQVQPVYRPIQSAYRQTHNVYQELHNFYQDFIATGNRTLDDDEDAIVAEPDKSVAPALHRRRQEHHHHGPGFFKRQRRNRHNKPAEEEVLEVATLPSLVAYEVSSLLWIFCATIPHMAAIQRSSKRRHRHQHGGAEMLGLLVCLAGLGLQALALLPLFCPNLAEDGPLATIARELQNDILGSRAQLLDVAEAVFWLGMFVLNLRRRHWWRRWVSGVWVCLAVSWTWTLLHKEWWVAQPLPAMLLDRAPSPVASWSNGTWTAWQEASQQPCPHPLAVWETTTRASFLRYNVWAAPNRTAALQECVLTVVPSGTPLLYSDADLEEVWNMVRAANNLL